MHEAYRGLAAIPIPPSTTLNFKLTHYHRSVKPSLYDIRQEIRHLEEAMAGKTAESFATDWVLRLAVQRCIEIISEAAKRLPSKLTDAHPEVPWRKVRGIGNVLRHEYDRVADQAIYEVIRDHIPILKSAILAIEANLDEPEE
jgi:uncharacterized protein with HEPN domain